MSLGPTLETLTDVAEAAWPGFRLERSAFQRHLLSCVDGESGDAAHALSSLRASDLYLALACALGIPEAQREFATRYLSGVKAQLHRYENASLLADEVRREIEDNLLFGRGAAPGRIGQYRGRAPLEHFVAVTVRNAAATLLRARRHVDLAEFEALACQLVSSADGSDGVVTARYEVVVRDALRAALLRLDRRQRTIVRLHLVRGVTQTQIARMLKVHQTTISRVLDAAVQTLHAQIRRHLREIEGMNESEMHSIIRDVGNRIDLSLSRILRSTQHGT